MSTCDTVNQQLSAEARLSREERLTAQRKGVGKVRESDGVGTFGLATRERSGGWVFFFTQELKRSVWALMSEISASSAAWAAREET